MPLKLLRTQSAQNVPNIRRIARPHRALAVRKKQIVKRLPKHLAARKKLLAMGRRLAVKRQKANAVRKPQVSATKKLKVIAARNSFTSYFLKSRSSIESAALFYKTKGRNLTACDP